MRTLIAFSIGIIAVGSSCLARQASVCSLLTHSEIERVTGAWPDAGTQSDVSPAKGVSTHNCMYLLPSQRGVLTVAVMPKLTEASVAAIAKMNVGADTLEAKQWTQEMKDYGSTMCFMMSSPATAKAPSVVTSCTGEAKEQTVTIMWMTPGQKLDFDKAKELLDKAIAKLP